MLMYHGHGLRDYALRPVGIMARRLCEFQAVLRGGIARTTPEGPGLLKSRHLWLSARGLPHGWTGIPGEAAEVVVFHYRYLPAVLERLLSGPGTLEMELTPAQCRRLKQLSAQALRYANPPSAGTPLCHEQILMELSLMLLEGIGQETLAADETSRRVEAAMQWYEARMEENPSLEAVARAVACSPATLRRYFQSVMHASPKAVFDQLRFQRATRMMMESGMKVETVGSACGFGSASAFSRAFRHKAGVPPDVWRSGETSSGR